MEEQKYVIVFQRIHSEANHETARQFFQKYPWYSKRKEQVEAFLSNSEPFKLLIKGKSEAQKFKPKCKKEGIICEIERYVPKRSSSAKSSSQENVMGIGAKNFHREPKNAEQQRKDSGESFEPEKQETTNHCAEQKKQVGKTDTERPENEDSLQEETVNRQKPVEQQSPVSSTSNSLEANDDSQSDDNAADDEIEENNEHDPRAFSGISEEGVNDLKQNFANIHRQDKIWSEKPQDIPGEGSPSIRNRARYFEYMHQTAFTKCPYCDEIIKFPPAFLEKVKGAERKKPLLRWFLVSFILLEAITIFVLFFKVFADHQTLSRLTQKNAVLTQQIIQLKGSPGRENTIPEPQEQYSITQQPHAAKMLRHNGTPYDTYTINIKQNNIQFFWKEGKQRLKSLRGLEKWVKKKKQRLLFATNAGMYSPERKPQGLYIEDGTELTPLDTRNGKGNFYLKPNGIFLLTEQKAMIVETSDYAELSESVEYATQSGPLLLRNGNIHPALQKGSKNKYIRSGVGLINSKTVVFAISITPVSFYDFAMLFKEKFGCNDALYLDGEVSRMYLPILGRYDQGGDFGAMIAVID